MTKAPREQPAGQSNKEIWIALIGAVATIAVAVVTGMFGLLGSNQSAPAAVQPAPSVQLEGPLTAPLGEKTYFTLVSQQATRAEWSIGGFGDGDIVQIQPLPPSHQIWIEPTDRTRVGDTFTLVVTVFGSDGQSATASKSFQVVTGSP